MLLPKSLPDSSNAAVAVLTPAEFSDLLRSVELVVQSQAFSRDALQRALHLSGETTAAMTSALEAMGVIVGGPADRRRVLAAFDRLPQLLAELHTVRVFSTI